MAFAYSVSISYYIVYANNIVSESNNSTIMGFITAAIGLGTFLSTYMTTALRFLLNIDTLLGLCPIYALISGIGVLCTVVVIIADHRSNRKTAA
jgi:hypothetical protein